MLVPETKSVPEMLSGLFFGFEQGGQWAGGGRIGNSFEKSSRRKELLVTGLRNLRVLRVSGKTYP